MYMGSFELIPAIDIKDGRCVRLYQGDYERVTVFDKDPIAVAHRWAELGAQRLHVVDLDGAKAGRPRNAELVFAIVRAAGIPVQLGGGLRDRGTIDAALSLGVDRVVLGTIAVSQPDLLVDLVGSYGDRVAVSVDARHGWVVAHGWQETSQIHATDLVREMARVGVAHVIYTDTSRDGTMTGPNMTGLTELVGLHGPAVIASGGIGSINDLVCLAHAGAAGAVVGQALYTGALQLPTALETLAGIPTIASLRE